MNRSVLRIEAVALAVWLVMSVVAFAQAPAESEINRIYQQDQKDREGFMKFMPEDWKRLSDRDAQRRQNVTTLISHGALKTGANYYKAALVFQHGATADDLLYAHVLAMAALMKGEAGARSLAAQSLDRFLQQQKLSQVFGTQYNFREEAGAKVFTQEPYDRKLLPDALRRDFCVAPLSDQARNLEAFQQEPPAPDGCR